MSWITPKTDWKHISDTQGDFFEVADYNRIKGNINYLRELASVVFRNISISDMGEDKEENEWPYADEINKLSDNLETIVNNSYQMDIGQKVVYEDNGPFIDYNELNRIESACKALYDNLNRIKAGKYRLGFRLGARRVRV
jgi:hypothetical protein